MVEKVPLQVPLVPVGLHRSSGKQLEAWEPMSLLQQLRVGFGEEGQGENL